MATEPEGNQAETEEAGEEAKASTKDQLLSPKMMKMTIDNLRVESITGTYTIKNKNCNILLTT